MFRLQARAVYRAIPLLSKQPTPCQLRLSLPQISQTASRVHTISSKRPQVLSTLHKINATAYVRYVGKYDKIDLKREAEVAKEKLPVTPETVSTTSSIHPITSEQQTPAPEDKVHGHGSISSDLQTIKDTFDLSEVPREAYVLGLAGVLPYLATSMSTLGLAYEINTAHDHGTGYLMTAETAEQLLHLIEPIQVGYGAVIISFLGAVHWGFEWSNYGGRVGYPRYAIGVLASAAAWPSLLLSAQYALITQFLAFNFLYYADTRACRRGWTPPWYGTYRFVLTFIVGATIVITLIGRGELIGKIGQLPSPAERVKHLQDAMQENLRKEEEGRRLKMIAEGKAQDSNQESSDDDEGDEKSEDEMKEIGEKKKEKAENKETEPASEE